MQSDVVQSIRNELKSSIVKAKQIGQPYVVFLPEYSPAWFAASRESMNNTSYPYNDYITFEAIRTPLIHQLQKDYPESTVNSTGRRIVIAFP